ncbi:NAD-binding protein [Sinomonas notoginsengisoli]|uniref:NAD(P)-dependent oxidoreductase n=1 Tax=Sinomonas notoginsengisoli TaxID=1457311 RepID=UPI001F35A4F8|nr:NAD(P)-dependent oxidoreductase [Sinomonas notoginsengisoli]
MTEARGTLPNVGIIGIGQMGSNMAERLVKTGHRVSAYDPRPETVPRLASIGAAPAGSASEVAREADIVLLMVLDSAQAEEAIWGRDGFAAGAAPASVLCVGSSLPASYLADLAGRAAGRFRLVDSPVSGGIEGARAGTLTFMVAGAEDAVTAAQPVYNALGRRVHRLGTAPGLAATMKAINQAMFLSSLASAAEMVVTGAKAGLSPEAIIEVVSHSSGDSWALRNRVPLSWRNGYVSGGSLTVMDKDIRTALALAEDLGVDARVVRAAGLAVQEAYDRHSGNGDDPMIVETIEARAGASLCRGEAAGEA